MACMILGWCCTALGMLHWHPALCRTVAILCKEGEHVSIASVRETACAGSPCQVILGHRTKVSREQSILAQQCRATRHGSVHQGHCALPTTCSAQ